MNIQGLVCGIGINDADYTVTKYKTIDGVSRLVWICPFYQVWRNMINRVYSGRHSSYSGCSACNDWLKFSEFKCWMEMQAWENKEIDKDILEPGNKIYSQEMCVFIPGALNMFTTDRAANRGDHPLGVSWCRRSKKFLAKCKNPFTLKEDGLGYFDCPDLAHEAWRAKKHSHALRYAEIQTDQRIACALRIRYDMI